MFTKMQNKQYADTICIYHANCADGIGAAMSVYKYFNPAITFIPLRYDQRDEWMQQELYKDRDVIIVDFSFPRAQTWKIIEDCKNFVWLDHHKTALEDYPDDTEGNKISPTRYELNDDLNFPGIRIILDSSKSGACLAYEFFRGDEAWPTWVQLIQDYDLWKFTLPDTKAFQKWLWSMAPWDMEKLHIALFNFELDPAFRKAAILTGEALLSEHDRQVTRTIYHRMKAVVNGIEGLACNCPTNLTSDVGNQLAAKSNTFGLCWTMNDKREIICSLRSTGSFDVSEIAQKFGGGGHRNAAGFTTTFKQLEEFLWPT